MRSMWASSSSPRCSSLAVMASSMCCARRAPTIATWTAGLASVHATASCATGQPSSSAAKRWRSRTLLEIVAERLAVERRVRAAPVVGSERRSFVHAARSAVRGPAVRRRARRCRGRGCKAARRSRCPGGTGCRAAGAFPPAVSCANSVISATSKFETPTCRILPSSTSSSRAPAVSARATCGSGQCTWYRSM